MLECVEYECKVLGDDFVEYGVVWYFVIEDENFNVVEIDVCFELIFEEFCELMLCGELMVEDCWLYCDVGFYVFYYCY